MRGSRDHRFLGFYFAYASPSHTNSGIFVALSWIKAVEMEEGHFRHFRQRIRALRSRSRSLAAPSTATLLPPAPRRTLATASASVPRRLPFSPCLAPPANLPCHSTSCGPWRSLTRTWSRLSLAAPEKRGRAPPSRPRTSRSPWWSSPYGGRADPSGGGRSIGRDSGPGPTPRSGGCASARTPPCPPLSPSAGESPCEPWASRRLPSKWPVGHGREHPPIASISKGRARCGGRRSGAGHSTIPRRMSAGRRSYGWKDSAPPQRSRYHHPSPPLSRPLRRHADLALAAPCGERGGRPPGRHGRGREDRWSGHPATYRRIRRGNHVDIWVEAGALPPARTGWGTPRTPTPPSAPVTPRTGRLGATPPPRARRRNAGARKQRKTGTCRQSLRG